MSTANELSCGNCGVPHGADDIFCENCGYDFITGSLPGAAEQPEVSPTLQPPAPPPSNIKEPVMSVDRPTPSAFAVPNPDSAPLTSPTTGQTPVVGGLVVIDIAVNRGYFDAAVSEGELGFPEPPHVPQRLELAGPEIHIGRTSQGRAIHPDIDVAALTGDPAVSSRHAVIRLDSIGTMTVTDVGSTNGTYVDSYHGSVITPGVATPLLPGGVVYLGAWTSLTVTQAG